MFYQVGAGTVRPDRQLVDSCRPERIRRRDHDLFPFPGQTGGNFTDGGGFSYAVYPDHQNNGRLGCQMEAGISFQHFPYHVTKHSHDLVRVFYAVALYSGFQFLTNALSRIDAHVSHHQKLLQLFEQVVVNFRKGFQHRVNLPHYAVPCLF